MDKKKAGLMLLLVPIVLVILVFISNAMISMRIQADPDSVSETMLASFQLGYGILGIIALVCAIVGGILFLKGLRQK